MVALCEQMCAAFGEVSLFPREGLCLESPLSCPHPPESSLPGGRIWVWRVAHGGFHCPLRAEAEGQGPVLDRAADVAHPAAVHVCVGHCRGQTLRLGSRAYLRPPKLSSPARRPAAHLPL